MLVRCSLMHEGSPSMPKRTPTVPGNISGFTERWSLGPVIGCPPVVRFRYALGWAGRVPANYSFSVGYATPCVIPYY